ncbi:ferredoxin reductase family protein [Cytophagaceae bacterium ABcell3]|nr:ferredoxin reductase family protein [Cytophagaceae bacterium ABcell3]
MGDNQVYSSEKRQILSLLFLSIYVIIGVTPLVIATFTLPRSPHSFYNEFARSLALIAISLYIFQLIIPLRFKILDKVFGLDRLFIFHSKMGGFILLLILAHPILMSIHAENWLLPIDPENPWNLWIGFVAIILLLAHVLLSVFRKKINLSWETWRVIHDTLALTVLLFILIHSWFTGSDVDNPIMQAIWIAIPVIGVPLFIWHRWFRYKNERVFTVEDIIQEAEGVHTVKMKPQANTKYDYLPGQFHFIRFFGENISDEEHHFTISSSPTQDFVSSSIKSLGDFTETIKHIKTGDKAIINGPFGQFSYVYNNKKDIVFLAGGIGITPIMSMIRHMRDSGFKGNVTLLYSNIQEADIAFREELKAIEANNDFLKVVFLLQKADKDWEGEQGIIDKYVLDQYLKNDYLTKDYYICGPAPMITSIINILKQKGVDANQLHTEIFELAADFVPETGRYNSLNKAIYLIVSIFLVVSIFFGVLRGEEMLENPVESPEEVERH